jgi:hypothetical protein
MDRDEIAAAIPQAWTLFQLFLPPLMAVSHEEMPEAKLRKAEALATMYSLSLTVGLCALRKSPVPLIAWAIGVPVMGLLYEWSYNTPELTF